MAAAFPFELPGAAADVPADLPGRLHLVAQSITDPANPRFARSIVNRLWKRYLGLGLFEPVDDFRLDVPPSHPELLDWLAHDFVAHGCDLKHTIRLILTSRTYQLRYDPRLEDHFDIGQKDQPRYFRSPALAAADGRAVSGQRSRGDQRPVRAGRASVSRQSLDGAGPRAWAGPPRATRSARPGRTTRPWCSRWNCSTARSCTA